MSVDERNLGGGPNPPESTPAFTPRMALTLDAHVSPNTRIHVTSGSLSELARVMAMFNLVQPAQPEEPKP